MRNLNPRFSIKYLSSIIKHIHVRNAKASASFHGIGSDESDDEDKLLALPKPKGEEAGRWNAQVKWLNGVLDSVLSLYKRVDSSQPTSPASTQSIVDIALNLHRSTMQQWSLGDLTVGLYLLSLRHATDAARDTVKGEQVLSPSVVSELIYHVELAKGAYMKNAASLARITMLRECNVVKFVNKSSVMRPAYYIAVDTHQRLVIFGIRGTSSVHDVITDLIAHSNEEVTFEGGSVHFGTAKAAEWFIQHELETVRQCLRENHGFGLRFVGHSLGGATAALLAIMLRNRSKDYLGFCPSIISAVGFASPPCVSQSIALRSQDFVQTVVLQDDIVPRISVVSLLRLRNEILNLDWSSILRKEADERKGILDLVASTVEALSSVQDVARRYKDYASRLGPFADKEASLKKEDSLNQLASEQKTPPSSSLDKDASLKKVGSVNQLAVEQKTPPSSSLERQHPIEELFSPGTLFHIRGHPILIKKTNKYTEHREGCTLWKANPSEFFKRIVLTGTFFRDHICDSYYHALRDTLKGLPKDR